MFSFRLDQKVWLFTITVLMCDVGYSQVRNKIIVSTELWEPGYTREGGDGLYEEIINTIYQQYQVEFQYEDYMRTKALVKNKTVDFWLGAYKDEEDYAYYPEIPIDFDEVVALRFKSNLSPNEQISFLNAKMVWFKGYKYDCYFPDLALQGYEVREIDAALRMLRNGKVDFILGDETEIEELLTKSGLQVAEFEVHFFGLLGLYPGFAKTERAQQLLSIWDEKMRQMIESGQLKALFTKHDLEEGYLFQ